MSPFCLSTSAFFASRSATARSYSRALSIFKATAMKMLKARLYERAVAEREAKKAEVDKQKGDIAFGSQIRSYVFQPYTMVNDHRTELKVTDVQKVMDG